MTLTRRSFKWLLKCTKCHQHRVEMVIFFRKITKFPGCPKSVMRFRYISLINQQCKREVFRRRKFCFKSPPLILRQNPRCAFDTKKRSNQSSKIERIFLALPWLNGTTKMLKRNSIGHVTCDVLGCVKSHIKRSFS